MISERAVFAWRVAAVGVLAILLCVLALMPLLVRAQVPEAAKPWQRELTRQSRLSWGLDAPIATFAAQIETESGYNPSAKSGVGALGLAQFMPATAKWISGAYPTLGASDPLSPVWALRALATYDRYLWDRQPLAASDCDRGAFMLSAYNGGEGARDREIDLCLRSGTCDPDRWWDNVETFRWRAPKFFAENRNYARRILRQREPNYVHAGWGAGLCEGAR